jgi:hypothetical protein
MICGRCGHANEEQANYCSSCGAPMGAADEDTTLTLAAVEAAEDVDKLSHYLDELPPGVGLLVARHGPESGSSYRLDGESTTIGRHPNSQIFLDDITVSRRHVTIARDATGYQVEDNGSLNGTYVNRRRVDRARLEHGDEIQVGRYRLTFVQGGASQ